MHWFISSQDMIKIYTCQNTYTAGSKSSFLSELCVWNKLIPILAEENGIKFY